MFGGPVSIDGRFSLGDGEPIYTIRLYFEASLVEQAVVGCFVGMVVLRTEIRDSLAIDLLQNILTQQRTVLNSSS